ncbi:MAG TPA: phosphotransferase [Gaiellaceae bacterium]|nr:phosphotransferase [Gaiellaceae bacterium]
MADWDAEVAIDQELVRALLAEQFPELDAGSARLLAEGWDYSVWVVEERWAFRFTRREVAIPGVRRELEVLPRLARLLPVPVPEPRFAGMPSDRFPWPFFGAALLPGVEPADAELDDADRLELGAELGRVLRVLHAPETLAEVDPERVLPVDLNRRSDMKFRLPRARENLAALEASDVWSAPADVEAVLASAEALPATDGELVLAHGDLHQRNVLVDGGVLAAIIDWVDVCRADPCIDLVPFWSLLTHSGRERFLVEYGQVTDDQLLRSRVLAIGLDSMLALYAHEVGNQRLTRETRAALERTLAD